MIPGVPGPGWYSRDCGTGCPGQVSQAVGQGRPSGGVAAGPCILH